MHAKLLQLCPTLCDPLDYSLSGSSVHGILQVRILEWVAICSFCCCRKEDPFQGPESGSCLTLREELFEEMHVLTKQVALLERAPQWRAPGQGNPGELLCLVADSLGFYGDGVSFWVVFGQSFWLRVLLGCSQIAQPRRMPARRILGGSSTGGVSFWPFSNLSGWWWFVGSMFLTRIFCPKTIHTNGAWPGWAVSVSVLSLALLLLLSASRILSCSGLWCFLYPYSYFDPFTPVAHVSNMSVWWQMSGSSVLHHLLEFAQIQVHWVGDAI